MAPTMHRGSEKLVRVGLNCHRVCVDQNNDCLGTIVQQLIHILFRLQPT